MNPIALRLLNQQLICPQFSDPAQVVSHLGMVQAQDYKMVRWAVAMRTKHPSMRAFQQAFDSGRIVRVHMFRGTWQLVTAQDFKWMQELSAPKSLPVILGWMHANKIDIPQDEAARIREILVSVAAEKGSALKEDFAEELRQRGIVMDDHRLSYHIRFAEIDGTFCSGNLHPYKATYALAATKIAAPLPTLCKEEALALFARKFFQSHSPATMEDFVWWSGLNVSDCRAAVDSIRTELHSVRHSGREFLIHDSCRTRGMRSDCVHFLAPFDEYLIGYKSRDLVLDPALSAYAHNNSGNFYPVVAIDGILRANWTPSGKTAGVSFFDASNSAAGTSGMAASDGNADPFVGETIDQTVVDEAILREWNRYQEFIR